LFRSVLKSPLALAVLVTVANAAKPVTVDDAHYLAHARHISTNLTDPYGFTAFWWAQPEPGMTVLSPPVVPYWLALGMNLFGESPPLLKLWLFPFVYLLAVALRALLLRFARGTENFVLPLLMLSPAVLPTVNLMLDIPAAALTLASVELFARATQRRSWPLALFAGTIAALAMQTKYTGFVAPTVIAWYGITHTRAGLPALAAVCLSVALFAGWELVIRERYGQSHFWYHATGADGAPPQDAKGADGAPPQDAKSITEIIADKSEMIPPLVGQLGCLAVGAGLLAGTVVRGRRRWLRAVAVVWCVCFILICVLPKRWTVITPEVTAATIGWQVSGWLWLLAGAACSAVLLFRVRKGLGFRLSADSWFLVGWFVIELVAAIGLTPFVAARRVIGITLLLGLLGGRTASRLQRVRREAPPRWILAVGIGAGVAVAGIDTYDAFPEKVFAQRSADAIRNRPEQSTAWYVGHWGFQYYCERAGMRPLVRGETVVRSGDYVVLPVYPDDGFNRPYAGFDVTEPVKFGEVVADMEWDDWLAAKTVPNFYGGLDAVSGRDHPRLRVRVYRLRAHWIMGK
jgi:hypothetical protein